MVRQRLARPCRRHRVCCDENKLPSLTKERNRQEHDHVWANLPTLSLAGIGETNETRETHYERVPLFGYVLVSDKTFPLREERSTLWTTLSISVWMCTRPLPRLPFRTAEVGSSWKRPWRPKPQP